MSDLQNIVIIGASVAGANLANILVPDLPGTHRILLVDGLDFGFWPIGSIRAAVVPGWEKRVTAPLRTETIFQKGSAHRVIAPNKVIELKQSSIVLEKPFEGSTEIPFYKCVMATGAQQPSPMKPEPGSTEQEYRDLLVKFQKEIAQASKIVIVGGGAVGIELAGEIRAHHPISKHTITVVHNLSSVLNPTANPPDINKITSSYSSPPTAPKLSVAIEKDMKALKIDLIPNERVLIPAPQGGPGDWDGSFGLQTGVKKVTLASGKKVDADFVFVAVGNKPNVELVEKADKEAVVSGLIGVNEYLRVISTNDKSPFKSNYYAIGDCCSTPGWKNAQGAQTDAQAAATNILAELKQKPLKAYQRPLPYGFLIPLGPNKGQGSLTLPYLGQTMVPAFMVKTIKAQKLFVEDLFYGRFKGEEKIQPVPIPA